MHPADWHPAESPGVRGSRRGAAAQNRPSRSCSRSTPLGYRLGCGVYYASVPPSDAKSRPVTAYYIEGTFWGGRAIAARLLRRVFTAVNTQPAGHCTFYASSRVCLSASVPWSDSPELRPRRRLLAGRRRNIAARLVRLTVAGRSLPSRKPGRPRFSYSVGFTNGAARTGRIALAPSLRIRKEDQHDQFEEAFARYLPQSIRNNRNNPMESPLCADSGSETPGVVFRIAKSLWIRSRSGLFRMSRIEMGTERTGRVPARLPT